MPVIVASRNYAPGDVIYSEEPFVKVLSRQFKNIFCESCRQRPINLKACKDCSAVKYCNKICQKKDWSCHKLECPHMQNLPETHPLVDLVRILARTILKLKGKNWKDVKKRILGTDYSFYDIDSQYKLVTENRLCNLLCKETKELLTAYIGTENMPGDVDYVKILGKVKGNMCSQGLEAKLFYIGLCAFNLQCIPSSDVVFSSTTDTMQLRAIRKFKKGVDQITVRPQKILALIDDPSPVISKPCHCVDCSLPYGESVLSKILDESRAYSIIRETEILLNMAANDDNVEFSPYLRHRVEALLRRQEGVLGRSNLLRLRLLFLRCFLFGEHPLVIKNHLFELEKTMRELFGERYSEMAVIYKLLSVLHMELGNIAEGLRYAGKVAALLL